MGSIDADTGEFTSSGKTGEVTVELKYEGNVVGTTTINIQEPDELYFTSEGLSMDFGKTQPLPLVARYQMKELHYNSDDFIWSVKSSTPGISDDELGSIENNNFVSGTGTETMTGRVIAEYTRASDDVDLNASIDVEVGKLPMVAFDFEPINDISQTAAHFHWGKSDYVNNGMNTDGGYISPTNGVLHVPSNTNNSNNEEDWTYSDIDGTLPIVFSGNYDTAVPAAEIFKLDGFSWYLWPNATIDAYKAGKLSMVTEADGGQVRFGDYALELNFDYASYNGTKNSNFYMRYCGPRLMIPGQPNEFGVWVYADAETYNLKGYKVWSDICIWNGSAYGTKNITLFHDVQAEDGTIYQSKDIDWVGWMYCYAKLDGGDYMLHYDSETGTYDTEAAPDIQSNYSPQHPFILRTGEGVLWLGFEPAAGGGRYNGSLYFDNYRYVYGTNLDDLDNPVITGIYSRDTETNEEELLPEGEVPVLDNNNVQLVARFHDPQTSNSTGIESNKTTFFVDGAEINCDHSSEMANIRLSLANGKHSVTVTVYDGFGNYTSETRYFQVKNEESNTDSITLTGEDSVTMGTPYDLVVQGKGSVVSAQLTLTQLNSDFGEPEIIPEEGWVIKGKNYVSTGFKKAKLFLQFQASDPSSIGTDSKIATVRFSVPTNLDPEIDFFTYQLYNGAAANADGVVSGCSQEKVTLPLSAYYTVTADTAIFGRATMLRVTDPEGNPAAGVTVKINGTIAGQTNDAGILLTDISKTATEFTVMAEDSSGKISFTTKIQVMAASGLNNGKPTGLTELSGGNGSESQLVSWMANPDYADKKAVLKYSTSEDMSNAIEVEGTSDLQSFSTSKNAAYINSVKITGLEPDTTYYYQAGDGTEGHWSEIRTFKTVAESGNMRFFVLADTQMSGDLAADSEPIALLESIGTMVQGYDFGIQTGDYVDNGGNYVMWEEIQNLFGSAFAGIDVIHALGNHEYSGDSKASASARIFGLDNDALLCYSVQYGNIYIANIHNQVYGTIPQAKLKEAMEWLKEDAKASKADWKILSIHQPAYYTNTGGGNERIHDILPEGVEEAGIDVVFSGHDHSYARTESLKDGEVDADNGVVYFICGDLGEKSRTSQYAANTDNPDFHFAFVDQTYDALYLDVATDVDAETMTITARDSKGTAIDSVVLHSRCAKNGHEFAEVEKIETEDGIVYRSTCERCGKVFDVEEEAYTGFLTVKGTEDQMYFLNGKFVTGWQTIGEDTYHFGEDGIKHETESVNSTTCTEHGYIITTCKDDGETYQSEELNPTGHDWDENHVCKVCGTKGTDINTLDISMMKDTFVWDGQAKIPNVRVRDGAKSLTRAVKISSGYGEYYLTTPPDTEVGTYTLTIEGLKDYYGVASRQYKIIPPFVPGVKAAVDENKTVTLTWDEVHGATKYEVSAGDQTWTTNESTLTIEGLADGVYKFKVIAITEKDGETYKGEDPGTATAYVGVSPGGGGGGAVEPEENPVNLPDAADVEHGSVTADVASAKAGDTVTITVTPDEGYAVKEVKVTDGNGKAVKVTDNGDGTYSFKMPASGVNVEPFFEPAGDGWFVDVPDDAYFYDPVKWAVDNGVTNGIDETHFGPDLSCTRAQMVTFLWRVAGSPEPAAENNPFTDVEAGSYYEKAVLWAVEKGITNGTSETTFSPEMTVTRGQSVTFLYRFTGEKTDADIPFEDVEEGAYYEEAVQWAVSAEVTKGTSETSFEPESPCTRAQIVTFLYRVMAE